MKYILVIDDERIFPSLATKDKVVIYARTNEEARAFLADPHTIWEEVWFDHDLGVGGDTIDLIKWMEDSIIWFDVRWRERIRRAYVHSMNPVGAANLRSRIKDFGIPTYRVGLPEGATVIS